MAAMPYLWGLDRGCRWLAESKGLENFGNLPNFTQIRWLSRGKCLTRFANLFDSVCECSREYPQIACLQNVGMKIWIFYMADIFELLNELNVSQGTQITLLDC